MKQSLYKVLRSNLKYLYVFSVHSLGLAGCGKCVVYLTCIWSVQLILAYSWARPGILVASKCSGGMIFISSVSSLIPFPPSSPSHSFISCLFYPFLWERTQSDPQGLTCCSTPTQSISAVFGIIHRTRIMINHIYFIS